MLNWTQELVAALTTEGISNLRANAAQKRDQVQAADIIIWCDAELLVRKPNKQTAGRRARPHDERNAEAQADAQLTALAKGLQSQYDLSSGTAKRLPAGIKGFRAHELLSRKGATKVGGFQRNGKLALDRYISYRLMNDLIKLEYLLLNDRPTEEARWLVVAPQNLMPEGMPIVDQVSGLEAITGASVGDFGLVTEDFGQAANRFSALVAAIFVHHE